MGDIEGVCEAYLAGNYKDALLLIEELPGTYQVAVLAVAACWELQEGLLLKEWLAKAKSRLEQHGSELRQEFVGKLRDGESPAYFEQGLIENRGWESYLFCAMSQNGGKQENGNYVNTFANKFLTFSRHNHGDALRDFMHGQVDGVIER